MKAKTRRKPITPKSQIRQAIDRLWLRSRERSAALKRTGYCCEICGVKQSMAKDRVVKIDVHHRDGCDRAWLADMIRLHLLHESDRLMPLCERCHDELHASQQLEPPIPDELFATLDTYGALKAKGGEQ